MVQFLSSLSMSKANNLLKGRCDASSSKQHPQARHLNSESFNFDRSGISSINKPTNHELKDGNSSIPLRSKAEFVEKWLFNFNNVNDSASSGSSIAFNSLPPKRVPLSPLRDFRQNKRLKCCNDRKSSQTSSNSPTKLKKNQYDERAKNARGVIKDNERLREIDLSDKSLNLSPKIKVQQKIVTEEDLEFCRRACFGSPRRSLPEKNYLKPISPQKPSPKRNYLAIFNKLSVKKGPRCQIINRLDENDENMIIDDAFGSPEHQTNYEIECESPRIIDSELIRIIDSESPAPSPCILDTSQSECASPLPIEIQSLPSPQVAVENIELELSQPNDLDQTIDSEANQTLNDDQDIEDSSSLADVTVNHNDSIVIDDNDNDINRSPFKSSTKSESHFIISQDYSVDSDSTHFTADKSIIEVEEVEEEEEEKEGEDIENDDADKTLVVEESSPKISQSSSFISLNIRESPSKSTPNNISLEASPPPGTNPDFDNRVVVNPNTKRRKKPKKGSMAAKLQSLITSQLSFLRLWRHRMNQDRLKPNSQSVILKINQRVFQYGRLYIFGSVIEDKFNLLDTTNQKNNSSVSSSGSKNNLLYRKFVTILIVPEVVGKIKFNNKTILTIYPPWEIIDAEKLVLSILYFTIDNDDNNVDDHKNINSDGETSDNVKNKEIIIQEFKCPCLIRKRLDKSCKIEGTNSKPNVLQYIFDD